MPQLNPEFWISQIFWLTLTFGILYVVLSKLILPKISANLELENLKYKKILRLQKNKEKIVKLNLKNMMRLFQKVN